MPTGRSQAHAWNAEGAHTYSLTAPVTRVTTAQKAMGRNRQEVSGRRLLEEAESSGRLARQQTAGWRFLPEVRAADEWQRVRKKIDHATGAAHAPLGTLAASAAS